MGAVRIVEMLFCTSLLCVAGASECSTAGERSAHQGGWAPYAMARLEPPPPSVKADR